MNSREEKKAAFGRLYGENRPITGTYDASLSAKCANGVFVGKKRGYVTVWRGIPYARAPVGGLRWKAPLPPEDGSGVFEAYYNGKSPIQTILDSERASFYPQGEDCLYLNVWSNTSAGEQKPVMVFFHGGSYGWGGTADPLYDGLNLVKAHPDVVLVTVGYRTGLMGFVDFSSVPGGEDYPDAPNLGILDEIEALRWVRKNISAFGGDKDCVTIFGESAGGGSVSLLPVIPAARGLFRRVIAQSGSVALTYGREECGLFTRRLMEVSGAENMADLLRLSEGELRAINEKINDLNNFPQRDGALIPLEPYEPYLNGETAGIDLLIGTNADEMNYWIGELGGIVPFKLGMPVKFENDLMLFSPEDKKRAESFVKSRGTRKIWAIAEFYNELIFRLPAIKQAEGHAANGGRAFVYYWTQPSSIPFRRACHAVELAYVFGNLSETIYTGEGVDAALSEKVMAAWTQFARTGDPSVPPLGWEKYTPEERHPTMVLSSSPHTERELLEEQREALEPLLRYKINGSYASVSYNVPSVRKGAAIAALAAAGLAASIYKLFRRK
ncbi:MAG: carboxylesterase/lipase family protein [Oscillospiraceae bacterium]|nr:carboxylesterase/lipase family protein [Oscillospiraceae bacterium]